MKFKNLLCFIVAATVYFPMSFVYADDLRKNIFVNNAWVQAMPATQSISVAYMSIANNSTKEAILESVSSDVAGATEIHQMSETKGMMRMGMLPNLHIPAQGKVTLQPGGVHIMLINLKKPVNKGDLVSITLHFQGGGTVMVKADVRDQ